MTPDHQFLQWLDVIPDNPMTWADIYHCQPGHEFVYRFYNRANELLYVGITWSAKARWAKHQRKQSWWNLVAKVSLKCYPSNREALAAELIAIHEESPLHNTRGVARAS